MSYYLQIDTEESVQVGSNAGWYSVLKWSEDLDQNGFSEVWHLLQFGWCQHLEQLESQLSEAIKIQPPADSDTLETVNHLLGVITDRPANTTVATVTDGFGKDDGAAGDDSLSTRLHVLTTADAPNYKAAPDPVAQSCRTCSWNAADYCKRYNFATLPENVCDAWTAVPVAQGEAPGTKGFPPGPINGEKPLDLQFFPDVEIADVGTIGPGV